MKRREFLATAERADCNKRDGGIVHVTLKLS